MEQIDGQYSRACFDCWPILKLDSGVYAQVTHMCCGMLSMGTVNALICHVSHCCHDKDAELPMVNAELPMVKVK